MEKVQGITYEKIEKAAKKHKLNQQQKQLVIEMLKNPNRTGKAIAISAGYANKFATDKALTVIRNPKVQATFAELVRSGNFKARINRFYDEVLDLPTDKEHAPIKQQAIKELHKIEGAYAPTKQQKVVANISLNKRLDSDEENS